jgi:outer membrane protein
MPPFRRWGTLALCTAVIGTITLVATRAFATSLSLEDAIGRALAFAPSAAAAQSDLNSARVDEFQASMFPTIAANGEYNQTPGYDSVVTNRGLSLAQLGLNYTVFDGGRRSAQVRSARYAAEASALSIEAARSQIVFDTTSAYFDLARARQAEAALQVSADRLGQYVKVVKALRRSGRAIDSDVLMLQSSYDGATLALAAGHQAAAHASIMLGSMIGDFSDTALQIIDVTPPTPPPAGDGSGNPAYRAAARQVEAAKFAVDAARAERAPTFKVALTSGWEGVDPPRTFDHYYGASYDGAVSVPIFDGGLVRSHIDQAQAAVHVALAQQRQTDLQNQRDLGDARSRYHGAAEQIAILRSARQTADDAFALAWTRFLGGGNITLLEVISAYQQAENLRLAIYDQEFAARQATAQVEAILGLGQ